MMDNTVKVISVGQERLNLNDDIDSDSNLDIIFNSEFYTLKHMIKNLKRFKGKNRHQYKMSTEVWEHILRIKQQQDEGEEFMSDNLFEGDDTIYVQGYNYGEVDMDSLRRKYGSQK